MGFVLDSWICGLKCGALKTYYVIRRRLDSRQGRNFGYCMRPLVTDQNSIQEEIKCRYKAGNSSYYSVQTLFSSRFLSKYLKIKIYKTIKLPVVLYVCEEWSLTLWEERRLRVFENRIPRRVFGPGINENGDWRRLQN